MLQLRPYEASDAEKIVGWLKDEVSFRQWCADRYEKYPITAEDMNEYYERYVREDNLYALTAVDEDGVAGHLTMRFLDREKKAVHFGFHHRGQQQERERIRQTDAEAGGTVCA